MDFPVLQSVVLDLLSIPHIRKQDDRAFYSEELLFMETVKLAGKTRKCLFLFYCMSSRRRYTAYWPNTQTVNAATPSNFFILGH